MKKVLKFYLVCCAITLLPTILIAKNISVYEKYESKNDSLKQSIVINWSFKTKGKVYASVIMDKKLLYVGSDDGTFYAINSVDGTLSWKFPTDHSIRSTAAISKNIVCFQSGNTLYGLDKASGDLLWKHSSEYLKGEKPITAIDEWDYHHSSPIIDKQIAYYGNDFGYFYGLDIESGKKVFEFNTGIGSPIRTTPAISEGLIYFGDFEGYIYAVNLIDQTIIWSTKTYTTKDYDNFGSIISKIKIDKNNLYFGARNYDFQVLNKKNGELVWKYTNSSGGWVSGTPVIKNSKVYIGGSDTHSLHIFDTRDGKQLGEYLYKNGGAMFSEAIFFNDFILIQTGDAYNTKGKGYLYLLNEVDGSVVTELQINGNIFSTPFYHDQSLYVTSADQSIYSFKLEITNKIKP